MVLSAYDAVAEQYPTDSEEEDEGGEQDDESDVVKHWKRAHIAQDPMTHWSQNGDPVAAQGTAGRPASYVTEPAAVWDALRMKVSAMPGQQSQPPALPASAHPQSKKENKRWFSGRFLRKSRESGDARE